MKDNFVADYFDDKIMVIIALTVIAIVCAILFKQESLPLVTNIVSGLLGLALGKCNTPGRH